MEIERLETSEEITYLCIRLLSCHTLTIASVPTIVSTHCLCAFPPCRPSISPIAYISVRSNLLSARRDTAIINSVFDLYRPKIAGDIQPRDKGSLLVFEDEVVTSFGLKKVQDRGKLCVKSGDEMYKNMM